MSYSGRIRTAVDVWRGDHDRTLPDDRVGKACSHWPVPAAWRPGGHALQAGVGQPAFPGRSMRVWALLILLMLIDGVISGWNIGRTPYASFYVDAARSMSLDRRALAFGAFDPSATITLDKLSGFLVPQVLSTWLFGFHRWSVMLPQVIEGMITVLAAYVIGARWKGAGVGLFAALAMTTTPLLTSMFGRSSEDCLITMGLALAFWCWQSAILSGRLVPLLCSCGWVAVGFQAKMMQAWFIIPALAVGYLLAAPNPVSQRIRRAVLAGVVTIVLSLSWMTAIQLVRTSERPYIDGTTSNNSFAMVFGFNGFDRVFPNVIPGAVDAAAPVITGPAKGPGTGGTILGRAQQGSLLKLVQPIYATQVGWLYPLVAAGILLGLRPAVASFRRRRSAAASPEAEELTPGLAPPDRSGQADGPPLSRLGARSRAISGNGARSTGTSDPGGAATQRRWNASTGTTLAITLWLATVAAFVTVAPIPHTSYLAAVTVQIAVLAAAGLIEGAGMWLRHRSRADRSLAAALLALQTGWACVVMAYSGVAPRFLLPLVAVAGFGTAALLSRASKSRTATQLLLGCSAVAVFMAPACWTSFNITTTNAAYDDAHGGPAQSGPNFGHPALSAGGQQFVVANPLQSIADPVLSPAEQALVTYLKARTPAGATLMTTDSWRQAEPYIVDDGLNVTAVGGYTGQAPTPTVPETMAFINDKHWSFFLIHDLSGQQTNRGTYLTRDVIHPPGMFDGVTALTLRNWLTTHCTVIPAVDYELQGLHLTAQTLYHCPPGPPKAP